MFITALVASILLALVFVASGVPKVVGAKMMHEVADHFRLSTRTVRGIGSLEIAGSGGLLMGLASAPLSIAAAAGLILLMALATGFHIRENDPLARTAAPALLGLLAAVTIVARAASF